VAATASTTKPAASAKAATPTNAASSTNAEAVSSTTEADVLRKKKQQLYTLIICNIRLSNINKTTRYNSIRNDSIKISICLCS